MHNVAMRNNGDWLTLMYAIQRFVRERLDNGAVANVPKDLKEHEIPVSGELWQLAEPGGRAALFASMAKPEIPFFPSPAATNLPDGSTSTDVGEGEAALEAKVSFPVVASMANTEIVRRGPASWVRRNFPEGVTATSTPT